MSHQQKHLFILDPLEQLDPSLDSSLRLMRTLSEHSVQTFYTTLERLYWDSHNQRASCHALELTWHGEQYQQNSTEQDLVLTDFTVIHMRKEPPFDMRYITSTWLLESACPQTKVINSPSGLRKFNEKVATLHFKEHCIPALVSCHPQQIMRYLQDTCDGVAVIKPLDLYGGRGIEKIQLTADNRDEVLAQIKAHTQHGQWRLVQPFQAKVAAGEVRVFTSFGEPISWCLKIPKEGDFLANTRAGAVLEDYTPSASELAAIEHVSHELVKEGIYWVGYDVIDGQISEINVTSPRILSADPKRYDTYFQKMAQQIIAFSAS